MWMEPGQGHRLSAEQSNQLKALAHEQEENKERRNALFDISGVRGKFPQVFKWRGEGDGIETVYVGMAEGR